MADLLISLRISGGKHFVTSIPGDIWNWHFQGIWQRSECAVQSVYHMMVVSIGNNYVKMPFGTLPNDAICMPIFDVRNVCVRMRLLQALIAEAGYDPLRPAYGTS